MKIKSSHARKLPSTHSDARWRIKTHYVPPKKWQRLLHNIIITCKEIQIISAIYRSHARRQLTWQVSHFSMSSGPLTSRCGSLNSCLLMSTNCGAIAIFFAMTSQHQFSARVKGRYCANLLTKPKSTTLHYDPLPIILIEKNIKFYFSWEYATLYIHSHTIYLCIYSSTAFKN